MPKTPKRQKPALVLLERIQRFKMVSLDFQSDVSFASTENDVQSAKTKIATSEKVKADPARKRVTRASTRRVPGLQPAPSSSKKALEDIIPVHSTPISARANVAATPITVPEPQADEVAADVKHSSPQAPVDPYAVETTSTDEDETRKARVNYLFTVFKVCITSTDGLRGV